MEHFLAPIRVQITNYPIPKRRNTMKLSAPTFVTFLIAVALAVIALLGVLVKTIPFVSENAFWILLVGFVVLMLGTMFKGK
jgi:hypothetical protein